jgi:hypothetical protein
MITFGGKDGFSQSIGGDQLTSPADDDQPDAEDNRRVFF